MSLASLTFSSGAHLGLLAGLLAVAIVLLAWAYRPSPSRPVGLVCAMLKAVALLALGFCLLEPLWSGQRAKPGANLFAMVADNSQGLQIRDPGQSQSRGEQLRELLSPHPRNWQARLADSFELRRHQFDSRLQSVAGFEGLTLDGRTTALGHTLAALRERYHDRPTAGILLFTDGNATDLPQGIPDLAGLPPPITTG